MDKYPDADIQVYAVWFDVLTGDDRSQWKSNLLNDPRVTEYWDDAQSVGRWFASSAIRTFWAAVSLVNGGNGGRAFESVDISFS